MVIEAEPTGLMLYVRLFGFERSSDDAARTAGDWPTTPTTTRKVTAGLVARDGGITEAHLPLGATPSEGPIS